MKRIFLIVLDSFGIGNASDAADFGDEGSNTLAAISKSDKFNMPNMRKLGLFNIDGVICGERESKPAGSFARLEEVSRGKDTTTGHWEIAGIESDKPMPVFANGFPQDIIDKFSRETGRKIICNKPYSGTKVIQDFGAEQVKEKALIVYTSADSVFQIAAHEEVIPPSLLYEYCRTARKMLTGDLGVGRVIARPFIGDEKNGFTRTANRRDFSLCPPAYTVLNYLEKAGLSVIGVGKIPDIFANSGITEKVESHSNTEGMQAAVRLADTNFEGLAFINLVDFDMIYGHRNNTDGYAGAATLFDNQLPELLNSLKPDDILMITADHGCDPSTPSTDHSRENVPLVVYGERVKNGVNLGTLRSFANIGATIADYFNISADIKGKSFLKRILK